MVVIQTIVIVLLLCVFKTIDARILKEEVAVLDSYKGGSDPSRDAVENAIQETSDLLSRLRGYDDASHHICLELKYLDFASVQVSAHCIKLYNEPECKGKVSEDENAVVSIGKLSTCKPQRNVSSRSATTHFDEVETSAIFPASIDKPKRPKPNTSEEPNRSEIYDLTDFPDEGEFEPWKPSVAESTQRTAAGNKTATATVVLIVDDTTSYPESRPQNFTNGVLPNSESEEDRLSNSSPQKAQRHGDSSLSCQHRCEAHDLYGTHWEVCLGGTGFRPCPNGADGSVIWQCGANGHFVQRSPNYAACHSSWISEAETSILVRPDHRGEVDYKRTTEIVLRNVNKSGTTTSSVGPKYFGHEIAGILTLVDRVSAAMDTTGLESAESLATSAVVILDSVASESNTWNQLSAQDRAATGTQLIRTMESTMFGLAKAGNKSGRRRYHKTFQRSSQLNVRVGSVPKSASPEDDVLEISGQEVNDPVIKLPRGWTSLASLNGAAEEVNFVQMSMAPQCVQNLIPASDAEGASTKRINSKLVTFSVSNEDGSGATRINFQDTGIRITFPHEVEAWGSEETVQVRRRLHSDEPSTVVLGSASCVYWDVEKLTWSSEGCRLVETGRKSTTCECMHLTSFAVLMDAHQYVGKDLGITILTRLLCTLSCVCLLATIIIFKRLHSVRNPRSSVTIHLSFCLLLGNILVLTLMDRDNFPMPNGLCAFVGMATHYVFLAAFAWMGIEGFIVYKMVVDVFESGAENKIRLRLLAYGVPLCIVLTFLIIHVSTHGSTYGGELYCWLQGNYIWSFIVPVLLVCLVNSVVLVIALQTAFKKKNSTVQVKQSAKQSRTMIVGTLSLTCILGLTWIFGFFLTIDNYNMAIVGAYLFTILNASQGIFIFIFHCWMNKQVRTVLTRRVTAWHSTFVSTDNSKMARSDDRRRSEPSFAQTTDGPSGHSDTTMSTSVRASQAEDKALMFSTNPDNHEHPTETPC